MYYMYYALYYTSLRDVLKEMHDKVCAIASYLYIILYYTIYCIISYDILCCIVLSCGWVSARRHAPRRPLAGDARQGAHHNYTLHYIL